MSNDFIKHSLRFILLVAIQVLVLNNINFSGDINPYLYVLFILLLPFDLQGMQVILYSFLIGMTIDIFEDTGGINAAASVFIAYIRPLVLKFSFGVSYEFQTIKFYQTAISNRLTYILILIFIHHFVLFSLEYFNFTFFLDILKKTILSTIFTVFVILIVNSIFISRRK
ncbi:rod shape-determining protein MreD [Mesonia sp. K7]|uniref:rod shape-determining protein MreD n=1 Tax=Mesonia sp. K7 TaxID=2218606 RepID=UPI000DA8DF27|nr:rod shape-determining protein MreD [Mesonia sp. K7]PZD79621.1 rod shape-determining protein MreD [Mesonia sp. K7]